ncbi:cyclopropane-fatty-acyl-phospholipid synthase family protein [Niallia sp.]|uniref:cyclopropane-fatty-acyl-phospholipid synthase family protein n=1 Tax=Niallia sp. TaxID=2837523 RepID=UPI00289A75C8|nr:cyclopropane-fatty-acyl-phospholipid synthase family protein [Niallia sp.]
MFEKTVYKSFLSNSFTIPVKVTFWDGKSVVYGNGEPTVELIFKKPIRIKDIYNNASLALGEAYMDGKIDIKGSIEDLITSAYENASSFMQSNKFRKFIPKQSHTKTKSIADVQNHYDIGNDFYKIWLDRSMTYSCAYFKNPEDTLETAQQNKVDHILKKLNLSPGQQLLDIGCGWGNLLFTAVKNYQVRATGITLSQEQYDYVMQTAKEKGLSESVTVYLMDYRDLKDMAFDRITSVGMFEHVGKENLQAYFQQVHYLLKDDGAALIHGISRQQGGATNAWINKYIFPGGYIPGVAELVHHMTVENLQLVDLESLRRHYQKTLEMWHANFINNLDEIRKTKDERFIRMWDLYLQACAASFKASNIDVIQYLLVKKSSNQLPMTRGYLYT